MKSRNSSLINYFQQIWNYTYNQNLDGLKQLTEYSSNSYIDVNITDDNGLYPINYAVAYQNKDMIAFFLSNNARMDILDSDGLSILHHPIKWNNIDIVRLLLNFSRQNIGIHIYNIIDKYGNNPITYCLRYKKIACLELLISHNCDLYSRDSNGDSILQQAIKFKNSLENVIPLIGEPLFEQIINITNNENETILHTMVIYDIKFSTNIFKTLLNKQDNEGLTPLMLAILKDNMEIINSILANEIEINICAYDGNTALHMAIFKKNIECIKKLLQYKGIMLNTSNFEYDTEFGLLIKTYSDTIKYKSIYDLIDFNGILLNKFDNQKKTYYSIIKKYLPQYLPFIVLPKKMIDYKNIKETNPSPFIKFILHEKIETWSGSDFEIYCNINYIKKKFKNKLQTIDLLISNLHCNSKLQYVFDLHKIKPNQFSLDNLFFWWINNQLIEPEKLDLSQLFIQNKSTYTILPIKIMHIGNEIDRAHLNLIIIHHHYKIIWRYDPYGTKSPMSSQVIDINKLDNQIKDYFNDWSDKYIILPDYANKTQQNVLGQIHQNIGLQYRELIDNGEFRLRDENKNCALWCFFYIFNLIQNDEKYEKLLSDYFIKNRFALNYTFTTYILQSVVFQETTLKKALYSYLKEINTEKQIFLTKYNINMYDINYNSTSSKLDQIKTYIADYLNFIK